METARTGAPIEMARSGTRSVMALSEIGARVALAVGEEGAVGSGVDVSFMGTLTVGLAIAPSGGGGVWLHPASMTAVDNKRVSLLEIIWPHILDSHSGVSCRVGL
jgi:hypothetical protein